MLKEKQQRLQKIIDEFGSMKEMKSPEIVKVSHLNEKEEGRNYPHSCHLKESISNAVNGLNNMQQKIMNILQHND